MANVLRVLVPEAAAVIKELDREELAAKVQHFRPFSIHREFYFYLCTAAAFEIWGPKKITFYSTRDVTIRLDDSLTLIDVIEGRKKTKKRVNHGMKAS